MRDDDLDHFVGMLRALVATPVPPPPRGLDEHFLAAACAAFFGWAASRAVPARHVPLREHLGLRQRLRAAEEELEQLRVGAPASPSLPVRAPSHRRP